MNTNSLWLPTDAATQLYADTRKFEQAGSRAMLSGETNPDAELPETLNPEWLQRLYNKMLFSIAPIGPPSDCEVRILKLRIEDNPKDFQEALDIEAKSGDPQIRRLMKGWGKAIDEEVNRQMDCPHNMSIQDLHALIFSRPMNGKMKINLRGEETNTDDDSCLFNIDDLETSGVLFALESRMQYRDQDQSTNFINFLFIKQPKGIITARELLDFYDEYCHITRSR